MFFCLFRFGSRDGPQPVSKQSLMSFSAVGQGIADFLPVDFFFRVLPSLSGASRLIDRTMSVSRIPLRFMGESPNLIWERTRGMSGLYHGSRLVGIAESLITFGDSLEDFES